MPLADLNSAPEGVLAAGALIAQLDGCFLHGFARLADDQRSALESVARTFTGTPLGEALDTAVTELLAGNLLANHLITLSSARAALEGARHDALVAQAHAALGRPAPTAATTTAAAALSAPAATLADSTRQWLLELALAGFLQLDRSTVAPFAAVLEEIQDQPELLRLSVLLTGFFYELMAITPTSALEVVPGRRLVDLWTRAMLLAAYPQPNTGSTLVSGTFHPAGIDIRHTDHTVSAVVWGVLDANGGQRVARTTLTTWKVDAVTGAEVWSMLAERDGNLLGAIAGGKTLEVSDVPLTDAGDLVLSNPGKHGKKADPLGTARSFFGAGATALAPATLAPLDRHTVQVAVPVCLEGVSLTKGNPEVLVTSDGATFPLALERKSPLGPDEKAILNAILGAKTVFGLLRFDRDQWRLQPLTVEGKDGVATDLDKGIKAKSGVAAILRERAGKLLRKKS